MKKLLSLLAVFTATLGALCFSVVSSAETSVTIDAVGEVLSVYGDGSGGFYILSNFEERYRITHLNSDCSTSQHSVGVSCNDLCYTYANNKFYFIENFSEISNGQAMEYITVTIFDCNEEYAYKRAINNIRALPGKAFGVDRDGNILIPQDATVEVYSENGKNINSFNTPESCLSTATAFDGNIFWYCLLDSVAAITGDGTFFYDVNCSKITPCEDSYIKTNKGELYRYNYDVLEYCGTFDKESIGIGILDEYLIGVKEGRLTAVSEDSTIVIEYPDYPDFIMSDSGRCAIFTQDGTGVKVGFITLSDFNKQNSDPSTQDEYHYASDVFTFDEKESKIYGLPPSTTIAKIKESIECIGYDIQFLDHNGNAKTSGSIGTGGKIIFRRNEIEKTYTVIIFGDLTGEGNINTKDKKLIFSYLLAEGDLSGDYLSAADINHDNIVDLKDLAAIDKYLKNRYSINQNIATPYN